jgi:hypothetical protein
MRMRHIVIRGLSGCTIFFPTLSYKRHDFRENMFLNIKFVFRFSLKLLYETFIILRIIQQDITINIHRSSCKVPVISHESLKSRISRKSLGKYSNTKLHENLSGGNRVVAYRSRDTTKLIVASRNFANAPKRPKIMTFIRVIQNQRTMQKMSDGYCVISPQIELLTAATCNFQ